MGERDKEIKCPKTGVLQEIDPYFEDFLNVLFMTSFSSYKRPSNIKEYLTDEPIQEDLWALL